MGDVFLCLRGEDIGKPKSRRLFRHDVPSALWCFVAGHCGVAAWGGDEWGWDYFLGGLGGCGFTPLCPAGHLPLKGGDRQEALPPLHSQTLRWTKPARESISPLEGEMSGRTEGVPLGKLHRPTTSPPSPPPQALCSYPHAPPPTCPAKAPPPAADQHRSRSVRRGAGRSSRNYPSHCQA